MIVRHFHPLANLNQTSDELDQVRSQLYRLFDWEAPRTARQESFSTKRSFPIELTEADEIYTLKALLPGVRPEQIDIQANGDTLTLSVDWTSDATLHKEADSQKTDGEQSPSPTVHIREFAYGQYQRSLQFTEPLQTDAIEAHYEHGVLTLTIPKEEKARRKTVKVQVH